MNDFNTYLLLLSAGENNFVKLSEWTEGQIFYTTRKATPELCSVFLRSSGNIPENIKKYFDENKRIKGVVAFIGTTKQKEFILNKFKK